MNLLARWKIRLASWIRYSRISWEGAAIMLALRELVTFSGRTRGLELLSRSYRRARTRPLRRYLEWRLRPWTRAPRGKIWIREEIGWGIYYPEVESPFLVKSLVLKAPGENEPGVLYSSFELNWIRLIKHHDMKRILQRYLLVGATATSPPEFRAQWCMQQFTDRPIFLQVSNREDLGTYTPLTDSIVELPIMACDWIHPGFYEPKPVAERTWDIAMVAGWSPVKRHWLLFDALRRMGRELDVVLVGQDMDGGTADDVYEMARRFGVADQLHIVRDASVADVSRILSDSRVSVGLTRIEGSGVVTAESLLADTPVAMMNGAHVGSSAIINATTGVFLRYRDMPVRLSEFVDEAERYSPRKWALENITCFQTTRKLNEILRKRSMELGYPWTRDIVPMCWRPDPMYVRDGDVEALTPAYAELAETFGVQWPSRNGELTVPRPRGLPRGEGPAGR